MVKDKVNAQNWLDQEFFKDGICQTETTDKGPDGKEGWNNKGKKREEITKLDISNKGLEEELIIKDFPNLEKIQCRSNEGLTSIKLVNLPKLDYFHGNGCHLEEVIVKDCPNITFFNVANNNLSDLSFLDDLNSEKLTVLSLHTNNFPEQGLEFFSKFTNLEQLFLDNCDEERFKKKEYNKFNGSLKPLQNLTKLELLSIGNTNISEGLEFLPRKFRKIGLNTSWWESDTSCSKLRQELEEVSRVERVTEKLKQHEEGDPAWFDDYYRLAPWREARGLLGEEGLKKVTQPNAQEWLDKYYPLEKRSEVAFLNINGKNLEGKLKLSSFNKLQKLDCSFNLLTSIDLSDCPKLTHLNCSWNKLDNTDFLSKIPNKKNLKVLKLNNNEKLEENLGFLTSFIGLVELDIKDCPLIGSLESLKDMNNLQKIFISRTHISKGLEYLPKDFRKLYCDTSDYSYKSMKIVNELSKFSEDRYYDVFKWKVDKQNNITSKVLPLERLFVIRSNIKKFVDKWGDKEKKSSELSNLQPPEQFSKFEYLSVVEVASTATTVMGGALTLLDYSKTGGVITLVAPLVGAGASRIKANFYDVKEKKWNEFVADSEEFLDNYHELLGILKMVKIGELGEVNISLKSLDDKVNKFLETYDKPGENGEERNGMIEISELTDRGARRKLAQDLNEENPSQLGDIVLAMKDLEKVIIDYRQGSPNKEIDSRSENQLINSSEEVIQVVTNNLQSGSSQQVNEQTRLLARIEVSPK